MYVDPSGNAWYHWALGAVIVAACAVAVVATAGGAAAGIAAVASVASGTAAATAASTVAAGAFIGSATVYGTAALYAAGNSSLESPEAFIEDFNAQGNWGTVVGTGLGGLYGAVYGYAVYRDAANQNSNGMPGEPSSSPNSQQGSSEGGVCFVAGTLISTFNGQKPIENVQAGDQVWAADPATGEVELKSVARTFINESEELVHVHVAGEEIITTPNHPFWGPEKGWTSAIQLRAGDILVLLNGEYVVVEKIQHEILESPITVYNFEVEDYHTYFVGENEALVHNQCQTSSPISQDLFDRTRDHIFSKDHIKRGIMNLGTSEADIFNKIYNAANQYSANWKVGQNQILSTINGYETTIRFYVQDGKIININAFVGTSERLSNSMLN